MRHGLTRIVVAAALAWGADGARAESWTVDPAHSSVGFSVRHLMARTHGKFNEFSGSFAFDEKAPGKTTGTFTAKAASIDTNQEKRDAHLRTADFFDVSTYPDLTLVVKKMTRKGKGRYALAADLTIRGVTKAVTFDVKHLGTGPGFGGKTIGLEARATINRKDFGLVWNKALETGGMLVGDDVELLLDVEASEAKNP